MGETSLVRRLCGVLCRPSARWSMGVLLLVGVVVGMVGLGGSIVMFEKTSNEAFCISCHDMKDNVYREFTGTVHDINRTGVRATCPDCHVPEPLGAKLWRKARASNEVLQTLLGTIDTREKFEAHRLRMAQSVWNEMKGNDSRECRNCHTALSMDLAKQSARARDRHADAEREAKTCIDCHKGVAHQLPAGVYADDAEIGRK